MNITGNKMDTLIIKVYTGVFCSPMFFRKQPEGFGKSSNCFQNVIAFGVSVVYIIIDIISLKIYLFKRGIN
jgi:hypothetical protein